MSDNSKIEWCDTTWNVVTGCTKVSAGCAHCYAETFAGRQMGQWKGRAFTDVRCHEDRLDAPFGWRKPRRVFVNSMSDLFHPAVPDAFVDRVFAVMGHIWQHTFQVLTKRPERMLAYLTRRYVRGAINDAACVYQNAPLWSQSSGDEPSHVGVDWPLPNLWLGVSVEDQATADARIPLLLQTPAARRFVSCEPLLGPVDLTRVGTTSDSDPGYSALELRPDDEGDLVETLDWVIVGGESGPKARPCYTAWIRSIVNQCKDAEVPCFVKQVGDRPIVVAPEPRWPGLLRAAKGADPSEWPADLRVREMPKR